MRIKALVLILLTSGLVFASPKTKCPSQRSIAYAVAAQHTLRVADDHPAATLHIQGNIAVLEADPELLIVSNPFDLKGKSIHYDPTLKNRYVYSVGSIPFDGTASDTLTLKDDDSVELRFSYFQFPFAGKSYDRCYVNSNGNITFSSPDADPPNFDTLVLGPPRIAPFFADLDSESAGTVFVHQTQDQVTISWLKIPEFFNHDQFDYGQNTFQIVLHRNGSIDIVFSDEISATQALVGIVPGGGRSVFRSIDFSKQNSARPQASFLENFHDYESVDIQGLMQALYKQIPDKFDFVSLFSNFDLTPVPGDQAFSIVTQNDVRGIGDPSGRNRPLFSINSQYGSGKNLQAIRFFGNIHQYPSNPYSPLPDTSTSLLQIIAHETGHRWLSYVDILHDGRNSDSLLGREKSHWSFFFNSNGSFLEGNQIAKRNSTSFLTTTPYSGYSDLDLYLMGLIPPDEVTDTFLVEGANSFSGGYNYSADSTPEAGVKFRGGLTPVTITDIIAANGPREPDSSVAKKDFQDIFVLVTKKEAPATSADLQYLDMVRSAWEEFFSKSTGKKGTMRTNLK